MGCDIHLHIEVKISGKWHHYGHPSIPRSYPLFEKLAGVRGQRDNAIAPLRGVPLDMSTVTSLSYLLWRPDAHSLSWIDSDEIIEVCNWLDKAGKRGDQYRFAENWFGYLFGCGWSDWREEGPADIQTVRFIFWFDN